MLKELYHFKLPLPQLCNSVSRSTRRRRRRRKTKPQQRQPVAHHPSAAKEMDWMSLSREDRKEMAGSVLYYFVLVTVICVKHGVFCLHLVLVESRQALYS